MYKVDNIEEIMHTDKITLVVLLVIEHRMKSGLNQKKLIM
jgi:hypothetical protein